MTAEEYLIDYYTDYDEAKIIQAMQSHTLFALTAYRTAVLSALEKGEDVSKIDIKEFGR